MFEKATRLKLRFPSPKGALSVEALWDLPLKSANGTSLDALAIASNKKVKEREEFSFVDEVQKDTVEALRLDILKHIIRTKQAEHKQRQEAAQNRSERQRLLQLIDDKKHSELAELSVEELKKKLDQLED